MDWNCWSSFNTIDEQKHILSRVHVVLGSWIALRAADARSFGTSGRCGAARLACATVATSLAAQKRTHTHRDRTSAQSQALRVAHVARFAHVFEPLLGRGPFTPPTNILRSSFSPFTKTVNGETPRQPALRRAHHLPFSRHAPNCSTGNPTACHEI